MVIWKGVLMLSLCLTLPAFPCACPHYSQQSRTSPFSIVWLFSWAAPGGKDQGGFHRNAASPAQLSSPTWQTERTVFVLSWLRSRENVYVFFIKIPSSGDLERRIRKKVFFPISAIDMPLNAKGYWLSSWVENRAGQGGAVGCHAHFPLTSCCLHKAVTQRHVPGASQCPHC